MTTTISHWARGARFDGTSDRWAEVTNPASGKGTGRVALASREDAEHGKVLSDAAGEISRGQEVVEFACGDEAVALVNANPYGNGTAVFTNDGGAARRYQADVNVGMIGVNVPVPVPVAYYSFGGWRRSLFGDTHAHGTEGVHFYTRGKVVTSRWVDPANRPEGGLELGFPQNV